MYRVKLFDKDYGDYLYLTECLNGNLSKDIEDAYLFKDKVSAKKVLKRFGDNFEIEKVKKLKINEFFEIEFYTEKGKQYMVVGGDSCSGCKYEITSVEQAGKILVDIFKGYC